jgi:hypothetical protein
VDSYGPLFMFLDIEFVASIGNCFGMHGSVSSTFGSQIVAHEKPFFFFLKWFRNTALIPCEILHSSH